MGELGSYSDEEHANVLRLLDAENITEQYLVGPNFAEASAKIPTRANRQLFTDTAALAEYLKSAPLSGHLILVKGSRAVGLEKIADLL